MGATRHRVVETPLGAAGHRVGETPLGAAYHRVVETPLGAAYHRVVETPLGAAYHRVVETPLGALTLVGVGDVLTGVYYPGHRPGPDRSRFGAADPEAFAAAARELAEYLAGERSTFTFRVTAQAPGASPLRRAVWSQIAAIPYGTTRTYRELAAELGTHPRAVGGAVAHNPLSIVIPCHRVVGSDGSLTGYAGGLERKRALLALERAAVSSARGEITHRS